MIARVSNNSKPPASIKIICNIVIPKYIIYKRRAVVLILGTSFPTEGPGLSARIRLICEPPLNGITASRKTNTPMPPIQCVKLRQNKLQCERASTSLRIEAPVVVKPDTVSKSASVNEGISPESQKGKAPNKLIIIQLNAVAALPSFK